MKPVIHAEALVSGYLIEMGGNPVDGHYKNLG
jgi:hypothetical protein